MGSKSFVTNCYRFTGQHGSLVEKLPTFETYILHDVTILFEDSVKHCEGTHESFIGAFPAFYMVADFLLCASR